MKQAAFRDRDGVANVDRAYVHRWEDFEFLPGVMDAMRRLKDAGYRLVIVTSQSGIARGYFTEQQYLALTDRMVGAIRIAGVVVDAVYHCPHHPTAAIHGAPSSATVASLRPACCCAPPSSTGYLYATQC